MKTKQTVSYYILSKVFASNCLFSNICSLMFSNVCFLICLSIPSLIRESGVMTRNIVSVIITLQGYMSIIEQATSSTA